MRKAYGGDLYRYQQLKTMPVIARLREMEVVRLKCQISGKEAVIKSLTTRIHQLTDQIKGLEMMLTEQEAWEVLRETADATMQTGGWTVKKGR